MAGPNILWQHHDPARTDMYRFKQNIERKRNLTLPTYHDLYNYSITRRADFWADAWEDFGIIHEGSYTTVVDESARIDSVPQWFSGIRVNFAENILYSGTSSEPSIPSKAGKEDDKIALVEVREGCSSSRPFTWRQLRSRVSLFASALRARGVKKGDRVAVVASNSIDTACVFLGTTSLGGLFSSSSTDMGAKGVLDRLTQIRPKWVFVDDVALYNGKETDLRTKMNTIITGMKDVGEFRGLVSMPRFEQARDVGGLEGVTSLKDFLKNGKEEEMKFQRVGFGEGFLIVYSSGTTGLPKAIIHAVGGVLISATKEGRLHREIGVDSVGLQYTTTGWIMYLACIQTLLFGAKLIMYDGSPFIKDPTTFLRLVAQHGVTHLGISPRYLATLQSAALVPKSIADLSTLRVVTSTGMVLSHALFTWFYEVFPTSAHLANISGGTDLAGAFGDCTPLLPVYDSGGCQCRSLGVDVRVFDREVEGRLEGREVSEGVPGELVAIKAFPNMPVGFWGDEGGKKYFSAYFERFDNVWTHGDFVLISPTTKALIFLGRADGVLNPSGVRFGSAEIYSIIETHFPTQIADSICVGQKRPQDDDERVMLFLLLRDGEKFTQELVQKVKWRIREGLSARHVPKYLFQTWEIPTTVNLKKVELPVKQIVSGQVIKPSGTLLNPDSLDFYYRFARVEELVATQSKL